MKSLARIFLLFTLVAFASVTSASAAMPCCMKGVKASAEECHSAHQHKAALHHAANTSSHAKHGAINCDKCQCSQCFSSAFLNQTVTADIHPALIDAVIASNVAVYIPHEPRASDDPPKSRS